MNFGHKIDSKDLLNLLIIRFKSVIMFERAIKSKTTNWSSTLYIQAELETLY